MHHIIFNKDHEIRIGYTIYVIDDMVFVTNDFNKGKNDFAETWFLIKPLLGETVEQRRERAQAIINQKLHESAEIIDSVLDGFVESVNAGRKESALNIIGRRYILREDGKLEEANADD